MVSDSSVSKTSEWYFLDTALHLSLPVIWWLSIGLQFGHQYVFVLFNYGGSEQIQGQILLSKW